MTLFPIQSSSSAEPAIVLDGTTIPIASTITITEADGSAIVIGPSGIVIGSDTVPIPISPSTITTDGEILTFVGVPTGPTPTGLPLSNSPEAPSGTPVITPPPAGAPGSIPTNIPPKISPAPEVDIIFQGETYMLPWTDSVDLLQSDGSTVTLASSQIVSGTVTLTIPAVSSPTTLSLNGLTITAQPGPVGTPSSGGLFGFAGLINALENLAGSATSIVNTLDQISNQGVLWAAGGLSDSSFSGSVDGLLNTATSDLSSFISSMNGVFEEFNKEVYELTEDGLRRVFPARTGALEEFDILKALRKLTTNLINIRTDVISKIKQYWIQGATAAAVLAAAEEALRNFADYPWVDEKPQPVSSTVTNSTVTNNRTTTSCNPSATPDENSVSL